MLIELKEIKSDKTGELLDRCISDYEQYQSITVTKDELDEISDYITYNNNQLTVDLDIERYQEIVDSNLQQYEKKAQLCYLIFKEFKDINGYMLPFNIAFKEEVWTYLNLAYFRDMIMKLLFDDDEDKYYNSRIKRYYFNYGNISKIDRTSFRFFWYFAYALDGDLERLMIAWEFIDPVKSVFERTIARNPRIIKAYVDSIKNNNCDTRFKSDKYRKLIPKNFNSYAAITMLDSIEEYDELVDVVSALQKELLNI